MANNIDAARLNVDSSHRDDIEVKLESNCTMPSDNNMTCSGVGDKTVIRYKAKITFKESICSPEVEKGEVSISLRGFDDSLTIRLNCEKCDCPVTERHSKYCNGTGTFGEFHVKSQQVGQFLAALKRSPSKPS